jgi:sulfatase modifying factor 1
MSYISFMNKSRFLLTILVSAALLAGSCAGEKQADTGAECCSGITRELPGVERKIILSEEEKAVFSENTPEGMAFIPGGLAKIGSESGLPSEQPVFTTYVNPFYMDRDLVTVGNFRKFVEETGYQTYSDIIGDGIIFSFDEARWMIRGGVNWEYPLGRSKAKAPDDHPVTLLTNTDAEAYLKWVGKRLPTEFEWEHAARGITNRDDPYAWGRELAVDGKYMANTWNGQFPVMNVADDGYLLTSPVGSFGESEPGLTDMGGNVWEWTSSWFLQYDRLDDPYEPGPESEKVLRGGSFMCHESYCHGYRVSARSNTPPDNNMFHIGFRGVRDIKNDEQQQ